MACGDKEFRLTSSVISVLLRISGDICSVNGCFTNRLTVFSKVMGFGLANHGIWQKEWRTNCCQNISQKIKRDGGQELFNKLYQYCNINYFPDMKL